jgi:hypothetical protein
MKRKRLKYWNGKKSWNNGMVEHLEKTKKRNGINQCCVGFNALHPLFQYSINPTFRSSIAILPKCIKDMDTVTVS